MEAKDTPFEKEKHLNQSFIFRLQPLIFTWMFQEVSKWLVNGLFHLLINGIYGGYNPLDIQAGV